MPVGSEVLIAGPYTATYNGVALGVFEGDAGLPTLERTDSEEAIGNTSAYGKAVIDGIFLGSNWTAQFTCIEYKAGPLSAFAPYHATLGAMGTVGVLLYSLSKALIFTAVAGTSASATPTTLTSLNTLLLPGFSARLMYGPTLRKVPLRLRLFPYLVGNVVSHFTQT